MPRAEIQRLFSETLLGDYQDDAPWDAVDKLRREGTKEVFNVAAAWCSSIDPLMRARGIDVLAQLGKTAEHPSNILPDESYSVITNLLAYDRDLRPLDSAITALGHLDDPRAVPLIASFSSHPIAEIRFAVAFALGKFPNDPLSEKTLLTLVADDDDEVRDWATFGVGVLGDSDSAAVKDALVRAVNDSNENVREEALCALGKRQDKRALTSLLAALEQPTVTDRVIEAARNLLGLDGEENWTPQDYVNALNDRFLPKTRP